jgi:RimJ/RimL family protein N-acetyltransferase
MLPAGGSLARMSVVATTARLALVTIPADELAAIRVGDRVGRSWADDYPTEADRMLADLALGSGVSWVKTDAPWGPLQVRRLEGNIAIGGAGFKGRPDEAGEVEIGYGLAPSARRAGYATEAVGALIDLARVSGVRAVVAETTADNVASQRVLRKHGFEVVAGEDAAQWWWRLEL